MTYKFHSHVFKLIMTSSPFNTFQKKSNTAVKGVSSVYTDVKGWISNVRKRDFLTQESSQWLCDYLQKVFKKLVRGGKILVSNKKFLGHGCKKLDSKYETHFTETIIQFNGHNYIIMAFFHS